MQKSSFRIEALVALLSACNTQERHPEASTTQQSGIVTVSAGPSFSSTSSLGTGEDALPTGQDPTTGTTTSGTTTSGEPGGTVTTGSGSDVSTMSLLPDAGDVNSSESGGDFMKCAEAHTSAQPKPLPVDILILADNSGSMDEENSKVQANLNTFAAQLKASSLDYRLTLVSAYPVGDTAGICIPPPLGSGHCGETVMGNKLEDSMPPHYVHVDEFVGSNNALSIFLSTVNLWHPNTRPTARKHILVITDDDATHDGEQYAEAAAEFHAQVTKLPGFFGRYAFHAVAGLDTEPLCSTLASPGLVYAELVIEKPGERLPGIFSDLCADNYEPVFTALSTEIIEGALLPCQFALPKADQLDPAKVNVYIELDGQPSVIYKVESESACGEADGGLGWYYDMPQAPSAILLCPQACSAGQVEGAALTLEVGCATTVPG